MVQSLSDINCAVQKTIFKIKFDFISNYKQSVCQLLDKISQLLDVFTSMAETLLNICM